MDGRLGRGGRFCARSSRRDKLLVGLVAADRSALRRRRRLLGRRRLGRGADLPRLVVAGQSEEGDCRRHDHRTRGGGDAASPNTSGG